MELFQLFGKIAVDNTEANQSIEETTDEVKKGKKGLGEFSEEGEKTESRFGKAMGKVGSAAAAVGKTIATGLAVGATAMTGLTIKALNLTGELEQNMGGSEAVFKDYAGKMQETAKSAFGNMGLSTSDFLATANKMGALFQGAGFDIQSSADLSSQAMQRAADVASIMGIDTASAMEAVAGAAKGNFTMMDNLGVAMNDTQIQAYALSKGIEKSTQEMTQQEKIGLAMEMFLDKTSYAAGNYAKENETLAGSLGTAKAALSNFLDGSGDVDSLVTALSGAADVIIKNVDELFPRLVTGITDLINKLLPKIPPLLNKLLPGIISGAIILLEGLVNALPAVIDVLMDALPLFIQGIEKIFTAIVNALPQIIKTLVDALPTLIPQLVNGLVNMIVVLMTKLPEIIQPIIDRLPEIIISVVNALMNNLPALITGLVQLTIGIVRALPQIIMALIEALPTVITSIVTGLFEALPILLEGIGQIIAEIGLAIWSLIEPFATALGDFFSGIWEGIKTLFQPVVDFFKGIFEGVINTFHMVVDPWIEIFKRAFEGIKTFISNIWDGIKNAFSAAWEAIKTVFAPVTKFFSGIWEGIKNAFGAVTDWFKNIFSNAWNAVKNVFSAGGKIFDGIKDGIANVFKTVVNGIINGINKVIAVPFNAINAALSKIRDINILGVSPFSWIKTFNVPQIPTMATGGVLKKGQTGYLEGDGDEAVVPLEKNTGWIKNLANQIHTIQVESKATAAQNIIPVNQLTNVIKAEIGKRLDNIEYLMDKIISILAEFFPELLEAFDFTLVMDDGTVAAKLTPRIDMNLGLIYKKKGRGN